MSAADALDQELGELLNEISEPVGHGPPTVVTYNTALPNLALQRVEPECSYEDMAEAAALYVQQLTRRSMAGIGGGEVGVLEESESEDVQSSLSSESVAIDDDTSSQLKGSDGPGDAAIEVSNGASGASALPPLPSMPPPARPKSQVVCMRAGVRELYCLQLVRAAFGFDPPSRSSWPCGDSPSLHFQSGDVIEVGGRLGLGEDGVCLGPDR